MCCLGGLRCYGTRCSWFRTDFQTQKTELCTAETLYLVNLIFGRCVLKTLFRDSELMQWERNGWLHWIQHDRTRASQASQVPGVNGRQTRKPTFRKTALICIPYMCCIFSLRFCNFSLIIPNLCEVVLTCTNVLQCTVDCVFCSLFALTAQSIELLRENLKGTSASYARSQKISTQRTGAWVSPSHVWKKRTSSVITCPNLIRRIA